MNVVLYGNGGSGNHGCEAIVRGTHALLDGKIVLLSTAPEQDEKYGLNEIADIILAKENRRRNLQFIKAYIKMKLTGDFEEMDGLPYLPAIDKIRETASVACSVGGDNYCYSDPSLYGFLNRAYHRAGLKTVLWGCSVEPTVVEKQKIKRDLQSYDLVVARESITYQALQNIGANVILAPDPAFFMQAKCCNLDKRFANNNVIGVNVSPHILTCESHERITYNNYKQMISYILNRTEFQIALIPHVVWENNDDRNVLKRLYDDFKHDKRIIMVEDHSAEKLKYIISKCRLFIGARTHSTIAAYSSCVPTLVVGYSVKARGIAKDLFGTTENYTIEVQKLDNENQLTEAFLWILNHENEIRQYLNKKIPEYLFGAQEAVNKIKGLR